MDFFADIRLPDAAKSVTYLDFSFVGGSKILSVAYLNGWDLFAVEGICDIRHIASMPESNSILAARPFFLEDTLTVAICTHNAPSTVKIESVSGGNMHILRASRPVVRILSSEKFLGLSGEDQLQLFSITAGFPQISCMQTGGAIVAVGPRWAAFALPPQQLLSEPPKLSVWDSAQRALDNFLVRSGDDTPTPPGELRPGIVGVREAIGGAAVGSFEAHMEPLEFLRWDPSGIFLLSASGRGHQVLIHKASVSGRGRCGFSLTWTLSRGVTPATISDAALLAGRAVVASARGTVHFYSLGSDSAEARVKFGSPLGSEGLLPLVLLRHGGQALIATRAGKVEAFVVEQGVAISTGKSASNFIRGAGEEFPTKSELTRLRSVAYAAKTSGDFSTEEGTQPKAWNSPQVAIYKGSFKGKHTIGMILECASKVRLESQRGIGFDGIKINLGSVSVIEASLSKKLSKMSSVDDKRSAPGSESPDGFIAI